MRQAETCESGSTFDLHISLPIIPLSPPLITPSPDSSPHLLIHPPISLFIPRSPAYNCATRKWAPLAPWVNGRNHQHAARTGRPGHSGLRAEAI